MDVSPNSNPLDYVRGASYHFHQNDLAPTLSDLDVVIQASASRNSPLTGELTRERSQLQAQATADPRTAFSLLRLTDNFDNLLDHAAQPLLAPGQHWDFLSNYAGPVPVS